MRHSLQDLLIFFPVRMLHLLRRLDVILKIAAGMLPGSETLREELCCLAGVLVRDGIVIAQGRASRGSCRASGGECAGHFEGMGNSIVRIGAELLYWGCQGGLYAYASPELHRSLDKAIVVMPFDLDSLRKGAFQGSRRSVEKHHDQRHRRY